jgi:hypothetical protein
MKYVYTIYIMSHDGQRCCRVTVESISKTSAETYANNYAIEHDSEVVLVERNEFINHI